MEDTPLNKTQVYKFLVDERQKATAAVDAVYSSPQTAYDLIAEGSGYTIVDSGSGAAQKEKRIFKMQSYPLGTYLPEDYEAFTVGNNEYAFTPDHNYVRRRMLPINFRKLKKQFTRSTLTDWFSVYFTQESYDFAMEKLYGSNAEKGPSYCATPKGNKVNAEVLTNGLGKISYKSSIEVAKQFKQEYENLTIEKRSKTMLDAIVKKNKQAATTTANLVAAKTVSELVMSKIIPVLPEGVQPFAATPLGTFVLANAAIGLLDTMGGNLDYTMKNRLDKLTEAMLVESMSQLIGQLDLPGMVNSILTTPGLDAALESTGE